MRNNRVPWEGRAEDEADDTVWAVTCVFVRAGFRRRGIAHALVHAAVDHARKRGARALEGDPLLTAPGQKIAWARSTSAASSSSSQRASSGSVTRRPAGSSCVSTSDSTSCAKRGMKTVSLVRDP